MESEPVSPLPTLPAPSAAEAAKLKREMQVGYFFAAMGAVLFSTKAIFVKLAYAATVDAETLLALRMGLSLPFYLFIGYLAVMDRKKRGVALPSFRYFLRASVIGLIGYWVASYMDFIGLEYISAQFERLILFTYPLFVVLMGAALFGHRVHARVILSIVVSYAGLALIFGENFKLEGENVALGSMFVLISAIAFALYQLLAKEAISETGPRMFTCIAMIAASLGAFAQFGLTHELTALAVSPRVLFYAFLIAVVATVLPSFFMSAALHRISAAANGAIGTLSPLVTIILAAIVLGEELSGMAILGTMLVLAGVGWFTLTSQK